MKVQFSTVPKLCPGGTVICIGGGPSLTREDVSACQDHADAVIAVNNAYLLAPWATALYAADARWWGWQRGAMDFEGLKYSLSIDQRFKEWRVQVLKNTGHDGLELDPQGLRTGRNSGYQAMNLAVHFGAARIVLLGYDLQPGPKDEQHWHGEHPNRSRSPYPLYRDKFATLVTPLAQAGVTVVNCSRRTALNCFPRQSLRDALCLEVAA